MSVPDPRILLVAMPYLHPTSTSLALGLLSEILAKDGLSTDCLHGSLLYPRTPLWDSENGNRFLNNYGGLLFGAYLADDVQAYQGPFLDFMSRSYLEELGLHGLNPNVVSQAEARARDPQAGPAPFSKEWAGPLIAKEIVNAGLCLDRCEARASAACYDVIGFSITFFTQLPASVALAQRLKARNPHIKIIFGGSGCVAEQADGMMRSFPVVDAVCYTEADDIIGKLVRALRGQGELADVPGIVYRSADGKLHRTSVPVLRHDLDSLPLPNHDAYFQQRAVSEWNDTHPILFFETSRGCWWGQKHLCSFCGLSERELAFRSKTPDRLYDEIEALYRRYPESAYLHPTDDILDTRYFNTLLPRLARMPREPGRPLRLFFEVKSNMRAPHLLLLSRAGVDGVQPGIESFSDEILKLMDKGSTGLAQVQFIKWATQAGVNLIYNLLVRNPGETAAAYREMSALIPHLRHLPPPSNVVITELERFSPNYTRREALGLRNVRPKAYHQLVFPMPGVDIEGIAYRFDYDHPFKEDPELVAAQREFVKLVRSWGKDYRPAQRYYCDRDDHLVVVDARSGTPNVLILAGPQAELFRYLDRHRSFSAIRRRFPALDELFLRTKLVEWHERGIVYGSPKDEHLALLPRIFERPLSLEEILAQCAATTSAPAVQKASDTVRLRIPARDRDREKPAPNMMLENLP